LGQETIFQMGVKQRVSSGSDEQVGFTSRRTVVQTNTDKDEMEEVVDEEEDVEGEGDVEGDEEEGEEEEEWLEEEEVEEEEVETEETEEEPDEVRELLSTHSVWLRT